MPQETLMRSLPESVKCIEKCDTRGLSNWANVSPEIVIRLAPWNAQVERQNHPKHTATPFAGSCGFCTSIKHSSPHKCVFVRPLQSHHSSLR
mmetsp:Transcript_42540/g.103244  ORF Transcript_42540/g.103244 Transcript_42540/m.103244 type:complete len:92 (-) Transcript_42540:1257-1532(-)